ncbi:helical backbone metal receptor [Sporosalibacterium faouarense]|uniref:helical backbone metal receptor n=1 Tax=Sporosalibacterium faouarense TaxID=516123 RepID=UPI00192BE529|nr:helical backbone metal receptor [Sporosalibacterium faouarense]
MIKKLKLIPLVLLFTLIFTMTASAAGIGLSVDGSVKTENLEVTEGRTLISGETLESMGFNVSSSGKVVEVKNSKVSFEFTLDTNKVKVNDINLELDTKIYTKHGEVYLPLRFILETLGYEISWDGENSRVLANKKEEIVYPITIEGAEGTYTVYDQPKTVVSLAPSVTETIFALGAGDKLQGRTQYCNYPQEAESIQVVGSMTEPSIEMVVDISPDMIIAATHYKEEVLNKFEEAGIEVIAKPSPETIEEMYEYTLKLGAIMNKNYEARALVSSMKSKVQMTNMKLSNIKQKPSVYYVVGTGQWGEYTAGSDTFVSEMIAIAGGENAASDVTGWKYSIEKLIDKDPDVIFGGSFNIDTMTTGENYSILSAIQDKNYYTVNEDIFSRPSPRLIDEGLKLLIDILHPEISEELDF